MTYRTGCRPQESLRVEARHVDLANCRWVFSETEEKNRRLYRVVYLSDEALSVTKRLMLRYPEGKLNCQLRRLSGLHLDSGFR